MGTVKVKKAGKLGVTLIIVSVLTAVFSTIAFSYYDKDSYIAKVNGVPIEMREFQQSFEKQRSGVFDYFSKKYSAEMSREFWTTSYNGEVPLSMAKERALGKCVETKIRQLLAKENGIVEDISYSHFLQSLKKENERRKNAVARKEAIYGPVQYDENTYFDYVNSYADAQVKVKLQNTVLKVSDKEAKEFYEENKNKLYKQPDTVKENQVSISLLDKDVSEEREKGSFKSFDDVRENVKAVLIDSKYNELVGRNKEKAEIKINSHIYEAFGT